MLCQFNPYRGWRFERIGHHRFHLWLFTFKPYGLGQRERERRQPNPLGEVNQLPLEFLSSDRKANGYRFRVLSPDREANGYRLEVLSPDRKANHYRFRVLSPDREANCYRLGIPAGDGKHFAQACNFFFAKRWT